MKIGIHCFEKSIALRKEGNYFKQNPKSNSNSWAKICNKKFSDIVRVSVSMNILTVNQSIYLKCRIIYVVSVQEWKALVEKRNMCNDCTDMKANFDEK